MLIKFIHTNGETYVLPITQVVVLDDTRDTQVPVSCASEVDGVIIQADAADADWSRFCSDAGVDQPTVELVKV